MKPILMFTMESCPYCRKAHHWMEQLRNENPAFTALDITIIDETLQPGIANQYDYYYVPTYYVDGIKVHEGAATKEIVKGVFEKAYE